ncbi:MAG: hypothetical protein ACE361_19450 [Aureliella sp.]
MTTIETVNETEAVGRTKELLGGLLESDTLTDAMACGRQDTQANGIDVEALGDLAGRLRAACGEYGEKTIGDAEPFIASFDDAWAVH